MPYNHYVRRKPLHALYITAYAAKVRHKGGGDYGPGSSGYDQLCFGTLTYSLWQPARMGRKGLPGLRDSRTRPD